MNWELIKQLLEISELSRGHPQLKNIHDAALAELEQMSNPPAPAEEAEAETDSEPVDEEETEDA